MKKVLSVTGMVLLMGYLTLCVAAGFNNIPTCLIPLQHQYEMECQNAKWKVDVGIIEGEDFDLRLKRIVEHRDNLLKVFDIKSFGVEWVCSCKDAEAGVVRPYARFAGVYFQ